MSLFGSIIPIKTTLSIVRSKLQEEINAHHKKHNLPSIEVLSYNAVLNMKEKSVFFIVNKRKYPFNDGKKFLNAVEELVLEKIKGYQALNLVIINYISKNEITADVGYITEDGTPEKQNFDLINL